MQKILHGVAYKRVLNLLADRILPIAFWLTVMLAFESVYMTVLTVAAALIHELGHIGAAICLGHGEMSLPRAALAGLRIGSGRLLSYREEAIIALFGPCANLFLFCLLIPFFPISEYIVAFGAVNLLTALSNLLPIRSYDGYRIMHGFMLMRGRCERGERVCRAVSWAIGISGTFFALFLLWKYGEGYWFFAVFFSITVSEIIKSQSTSKLKNNGVFERF